MASAVREEAVEFSSDGSLLRADLYTPAESSIDTIPIVVMAGGWCYVKELILPEYARALAAEGIGVLAFDYRNLGSSEGEPRQHVDPWAQIEDYRNAVTYLEVREDPRLDVSRMGAFGISYSGGHVLVLAGIDERIRSVVSVVPVVDGLYNMRRAHGTVGFRRLRQAIRDDQRNRARGADHSYMPMSADPGTGELATWPFPETGPIFEKLARSVAPKHEHRNTVASVELLLRYDVGPYVDRLLDQPVMMIVANDDDLTMAEAELPMFNRIPSPVKELVVMREADHMTLYDDEYQLSLAARATVRWFSTHL